jgi:hypothetical protein
MTAPSASSSRFGKTGYDASWSRQSSAVDARRVLPQGTAGSKLLQGAAGSKPRRLLKRDPSQ